MMIRVWQVAALIFIILIVFYLTQIKFDLPMFSEENKPFTISGMLAILGLFVSLLFIQASKLRANIPEKKVETKQVD